jgi:6-phosphogluconolactonase
VSGPGQTPPTLRVERAATPAELARAAAGEVARLAAEAVAARGSFSLALAGGSTPRALYQLLADPAEPFRDRIPWPAVHVFFGDERAVPPDHPESNYRMASAALLDRVPVGSVHRVAGELGAPAAAAQYAAELRAHFGEVTFPAFDLVLLGLGTDGHTASLFPGSPALLERSRWVVAAPGPPPSSERITLTVPVLEAARAARFLVAGADKAEPLRRLVRPRADEEPVPAARIRFGGSARVLADLAAAAALGGASVS